MKRWCAILLAALALVFWTGCNDDDGSGSNGEPDGMMGEPDGFIGQPDADPNPTPDPTMGPDSEPDAEPDPQPTPDPEPTMEPDAGCLPEFYQGLDGVFEGMLTTTSRGPNIPEQTSTSPFTLIFDDNGGQQEQIPGCTFMPDEDQCFFETGSTSVTECDNDGFGSRTVSTTLASTDSEDQYTQNTRIQSTTTQDGMILNESTTDQTFSLSRVDEDTLRYEANTSTSTPNGIFTSESIGTLRRAQ